MRAVTTSADGPPDKSTAGGSSTMFCSPRSSLHGWGRALTIDVPAPWVDHLDIVGAALDAIEVDDRVGGTAATGPVAFAALPFDRAAAARFVVPALLHGATPDGTYWSTVIDGADEPARGPALSDPTRVEVCSVRSPADWCAAVDEARSRIVAGALHKVVLARELRVTGDRPLDAAAIAARLAAAHPASLRFCIDGFVGASPELLVSRFGAVVRAQPMAGTTVRTGDAALDSHRAAELLASEKNRSEHQITIDMVHETLLPWCSYLDSEPSPSVVAAGPVQHLATLVEGRLSQPTPSVLDLVAALHPTPAVGGWPRSAALELIAELEGVDRGRYAGPVGWVDRHGNGAWAVGIRSAEIDGATARVFAGVGVVADSDPAAELEETRTKFAATLSVLIRP